MSEALFPTRWKKDKPQSIKRFMATFPDDAAWAEHLARKRWPDRFACPHCGSRRAGALRRGRGCSSARERARSQAAEGGPR
ncbi:transposase [Aurantimonas sp. MSK8Z-1]|nr:transposase [Aurantimonas sp. MSK8Z-1]MCW4114926.1 transposase [Aurantimonas sp. MSK8Z-1]